MAVDILYLASQSPFRQKLLSEAGYQFCVLTHQSDEAIHRAGYSFEEFVLAICQNKMEHVVLPEHCATTGDYIFVLTADTLMSTMQSRQEFGKPLDRQDAKRMLRILQKEPAEVITACCVQKNIFKADAWYTDASTCWTVSSEVEFIVDDASLDLYLDNVPQAMQSSGAGIIEGFGRNFFKSIKGSYSSVRGLPIFELRQILLKMGFKF